MLICLDKIYALGRICKPRAFLADRGGLRIEEDHPPCGGFSNNPYVLLSGKDEVKLLPADVMATALAAGSILVVWTSRPLG